MEELINILKKSKIIKKSDEKVNKTNKFSEKDYFKQIISDERKNNKPIDPIELSIRLGTTKKIIEEILKEVDAEKKAKQKEEAKSKVPVIKKKIFKKSKEKLKKFLDKEDKETIKDIFLKIVLFGIPLNFSIFILSKGFFIFNYYTWIGWGLALWFAKKEISPLIRGIIHK